MVLSFLLPLVLLRLSGLVLAVNLARIEPPLSPRSSSTSTSSSLSVPVIRRAPVARSSTEIIAWLEASKLALEGKYGAISSPDLHARASGVNL